MASLLMTLERSEALNGRRIVVKVGSQALANDLSLAAGLIHQFAQARAQNPERQFVLVTSGAIAFGCAALGYSRRPTEMAKLQAAASVGQIKLLRRYEEACELHGLIPAQVLLTHADLSSRKRLNNARSALAELLDSGALPIINENDAVSTEEIKFGDNDQLASMVVPLVGADTLLLLTDVAGVLDSTGARIPTLAPEFQLEPAQASPQPGRLGSGGMASKINSARKAARSGANVVIASAAEPALITRLLAGEDLGTLVPAASLRHVPGGILRARQHWIAYTLKPRGTVLVDAGAAHALSEGKSSLLPVGVLGVRGHFSAGDAVSVVDMQGRELGRGLTRMSALDIARAAGVKGSELDLLFGQNPHEWVVVHRDDWVLT